MKIIWLGQGGFLFEVEQFRLVIDPYLSDCIFRVEGMKRLHPFPLALEELNPDQILITHDHLDHLDPEGIVAIRKFYPACCYAGPARAYDHLKQLGICATDLTRIEPPQSYQFGPFEVTPVFATHSDPTACGYVLRVEDKKIYLSGDTRFDKQLFSHETQNPDLLLVCINGKLNNMNSSEAFTCVQKLQPGIALPMHIGLFAENTADPTSFIESCHQIGVKSFEMTPGKEFYL